MCVFIGAASFKVRHGVLIAETRSFIHHRFSEGLQNTRHWAEQLAQQKRSLSSLNLLSYGCIRDNLSFLFNTCYYLDK